MVTTFGIFWAVRRYSMEHPEELENIRLSAEVSEAEEQTDEWEEVGFHRPLGGFLVALTLGLVLFIPLIIYQNIILPVYILPSAQALGIWGRVVQFFSLAWLFFDMGTSVAFIKYLSQYRVDDPKRGIKFGQVFVWWQALSGAVQVALVVALASTMAPKSAYALYAWTIIIHAFIQVPGFLQVMRHALTGFQRHDYARYLDMGMWMVFPMLAQPIFVTIAYAWGKATPQFGGAMGGILGMGIAAYAAELLTFILGLWLYRRVGYNPRVLFLAHFDWEIFITSLKFGVFEMLGSIAWAAGQAAEIWITQARLINYAEIWGNWILAQNFVFALMLPKCLTMEQCPPSQKLSHTIKRCLVNITASCYISGTGQLAFSLVRCSWLLRIVLLWSFWSGVHPCSVLCGSPCHLGRDPVSLLGRGQCAIGFWPPRYQVNDDFCRAGCACGICFAFGGTLPNQWVDYCIFYRLACQRDNSLFHQS